MKITLSFTRTLDGKNGSMLFVHAIRDKDDMIASVLMEPLPGIGILYLKCQKRHSKNSVNLPDSSWLC